VNYFQLRHPHAPTVRQRLAVLCCVLAVAIGQAQDLPRPSISRARDASGSFQRPYNLKLGPIALNAGAALGLEYVDNLNLSAIEKEGDLVLRPSLGISAVWQVTRLNNLSFQTSLGYTKYLSHPELDSQSVLISPDSALKFNLFIGDVKIVFSEQFSFQDDPIGEGAVSNVATFSRFTNTVGVNALWDLNDVIWSLGYNHSNLFTTGGAATTEGSLNNNASVLDRSTDQFTSAVFLKLAPTTGLGLEGTAAYTRYPKNSRGDSTVYSLGPFIDFQLTSYTRIILSGGYQLYSSQSGSSGIDSTQIGAPVGIPGISGFGLQAPRSSESRAGDSDGSGYYFTLAISHRLNRFYSDRLSIGREFQVGVLSDRSVNTFINYSSTWQLTRRFTLSSSIGYEHSEQTSQFSRSFNGASLPDYDRVTIALSTGYQITRKLSVGASYQFTNRFSDSPNQDYTQTRVALQFGYQF